MHINREVKILTLFLSMVYAVWADAQSKPVANGSGYGMTGAGTVSATRSTMDPSSMQLTAPSDISTVNPMDPVHDSRKATDSQMLDLRRKGKAAVPPVSGIIETDPIY